MSLITYVTRIHFADRVLEDALPVELRRLGMAWPLVLADPSAPADDAVERLVDALPVPPTVHRTRSLPPTLADREAAVAVLHAQRCDGIIGVGGAGVIDLARSIEGLRGRRDLEVIAVPTTTTGMGLGPIRFGLPPEGRVRTTVPAAILCDPTLTVAADAAATAAAGMDALIHCIEAWLGVAFNPPADGIALEGVRRAAAGLERAVADGRDVAARRDMLAAALCAGLAAPKGAGGIEALACAVEAELGLAGRHGWLHAALLPPVLAFNAPAVADRLAPLRAALHLAPGVDLAPALAELGARLDLPQRLAPFNLDRAARQRIARAAAADPANRTNPRHATATDYEALLQAAD